VAVDPFAVTAALGFIDIRLPAAEAREVEVSLRGQSSRRDSVDRFMANVDDAIQPVARREKKSGTASQNGIQLEDTLEEIAGDLIDGFYDRDANDSVFGEDLI
jgi:hypothetical protein